MAAPKLRFKDSEGREFPKWENNRLGSLVGKISSGKDKPSDGDFILYGSTGIIGKCEHPTYKGRKILIARVGANAGFANLVNEECGVSDNTLIIKDSESCILNWLFFSIIQKNLGKMRFGSGQPLVTGTMLYNLALKVPSLPEQQKIADFLTTYDTMINTQTKRVETMKTRKKGLLQKIFSQEIRFKDDQGKNYPAWEGKYLSDIASFHSGLTYTPGDVVDRENGILVFRSSNVQGGRICYSDNVYVNKKLKESNYVKIHDIVVCVRNGSKSLVGKNALITENDLNATWGAFMTVIRAKENPGFIHQYLNSDYFKKEMYKDSGTATINQITTAMLNNCKLLVPSLPEQQKIADFLTAVDKQIEVEEKRLETMKNIKKGLLQQMFI